MLSINREEINLTEFFCFFKPYTIGPNQDTFLLKEHSKRLKLEAKHQKDGKANLHEGEANLPIRDKEIVPSPPGGSSVDKAALAKPAIVSTISSTLSS